jgi:hypothetical protein
MGKHSQPRNGGIAQLVERLLCKQDVSGSSPLTSTKKTEQHLTGKRKRCWLVKTSKNLENCIEKKRVKKKGQARKG